MNIKYRLFIFLIFISHFTFAMTGETICKNSPKYGYGKLYYYNSIHTKENLYLLSFENKYGGVEKDTKKNTNNISAFIKITIGGVILNGHVVIDTIVNNKTASEIIIPKKNFVFEEKLSNPIFNITSGCVLFDYTGQIVNYGSKYNYPDDFIVIKKYGSYHSRVFLDNYYKFLPGINEYKIIIPEIPFSFKDKREEEFIASSNEILIRVKI